MPARAQTILVAAILLLPAARVAGQEAPGIPGTPFGGPDSIRAYSQTLRGRLAAAEHELQLAERDLAEAEARADAEVDELRGLTTRRNSQLMFRDRLRTNIESLEEVLRSPDPPAPRPVDIPSNTWLECTDELRDAGLATTSSFLVAITPEDRADVVLRIMNGAAVGTFMTPRLEEAIRGIAESRFSPAELKAITAVYQIVFDCGH